MMTRLYSLLCGLALVGCATNRSFIVHDIPRFQQVPGALGVYRGGQPASTAAWVHLQSIGVSNVVKLNLESEASDDAARELGMVVTYLPIDSMHQTVVSPDLGQISNAVALIRPGTFVHCTHGRDRTGLVIGCKRVWQDGWSKSNAWNEMIAGGYRSNLDGLTGFWRTNVR